MPDISGYIRERVNSLIIISNMWIFANHLVKFAVMVSQGRVQFQL